MPDRVSINYIEFSCNHIPDIKVFYNNAFGWEFTDYGPSYAAFTDGRLAGGFYYDGQHNPAINPLVVLYAKNLEAIMEKILQAGGTIVKEIFTFPGGRRFHFTDPDENILAVWSE